MSQHIDPPMNQSSIVDNLTTNDGTKALSAAQGKNLKDQIPAVVNNLTSDSTTSALSAAQGKALNSNLNKIASSSDFVLTNFEDIKTKLDDLASVIPAGGSQLVRICYTGTETPPMRRNIRYMGYLKKSYSGSFFTWDANSYDGYDIHFARDGSSTWHIYSINATETQTFTGNYSGIKLTRKNGVVYCSIDSLSTLDSQWQYIGTTSFKSNTTIHGHIIANTGKVIKIRILTDGQFQAYAQNGAITSSIYVQDSCVLM